MPTQLLTVKVKLCVALGFTPLDAEMVTVRVAAELGVPANVAVPLSLAVKVRPAGRVPEWDSVAVG